MSVTITWFCYRCFGKRHEEGENRELSRLIRIPKTNAENLSSNLGLCQNKHVGLQNVKNEDFKIYFHKSIACPFYNAEKKRHGNNLPSW